MNKLYNSLSDDYSKLFIDNIEVFNKQAEKNQQYSIFYPSFGVTKGEQTEFLIYGQAVKGWQPDFNTGDKLEGGLLLKEAIEYSNSNYKEKNHSPLDWVNVYWGKKVYNKLVTTPSARSFYPEISYSTSRSFFWNVVYKLICRYYTLDEDDYNLSKERIWSKKLVWSNLYKIAPAERENPNDEECSWQEKISIELVRKEIEEIKPKFCIVLTNDSWWQPFRENFTIKLGFPKDKDGVIESVEKYQNTKIIVTSRPFRGSSDKHVNEILKIIK